VKGTGGSYWDGSVVLAKYLEQNPELVRDKFLLELGSGLGFTSIAAKVLGAAQVVATDLCEVLPVLETNVRTNEVDVFVTEIDWNLPKYIKSDLVICSDVLWLIDLVYPFTNTLFTNLSESNKAIICDKLRSLEVRNEFFKLLKEFKLEYRELGTMHGHDIWEVFKQTPDGLEPNSELK